MSKKETKKIDFVPGRVSGHINNKSNGKIDFIPCEAAQKLRRSNHSDINELKSYLNPRRKSY